MAGTVELEVSRTEQAGYVRSAVGGLISQVGGNTHIVFRLEDGARQVIQSDGLIPEARNFLLDTILRDELEITLHRSEDEENPYSEILLGQTDSLRGLQCYTVFNREVMVSPRQIFDVETFLPVHPDSCRALNNRLNQDGESAFAITRSLIEITTKLLETGPRGLKVVQAS